MSLEEAQAGAEGFVQFMPGELSPQASPLLIYPGMQLQEWLEKIHRAREEVAPLGCNFLRNVIVREHLMMFRGERLLVEGSHLSDVSIEWANAYGIRENEPVRNALRIEQPVINALGPGYLIYGHWIVDFIPRLAIAKALLGKHFASYKTLLPADAPEWIFDLSECILGIERQDFLLYDSNQTRLDCAQVCAPTFAHGPQYGFHSFVREIYSKVTPAPVQQARKICISRKHFEKGTQGLWKMFDSRELFEEAATVRGYEIVYPEAMNCLSQVDLFSQAKVILGEYGSALHNSVFSRPGAVLGAIRCPNSVQSTLAAAFDHRVAYLIPESEWVDERGVQRYACSKAQIHEFIDFVETKSNEV
ncbi:DUF563 domain-containing protein [Methylocystis sp. H62]|uniref:glycosyltransferase family 61 protein n=1 Tax=Methylocystis sp. H62 TaxID=2785789 RepID=UPI001AEE1A19|nr:glycosyltransferase 61 family protein [Methylocystis sp. H62]